MERLKGASHIFLAVVIILISLYFAKEVEIFSSYGYFGVFIIAFFSTATIIFPSPAWAAVITMSLYLDPFLVGIAAGTGGALGEMTGYLAGEGTRSVTTSIILMTATSQLWTGSISFQ